MSRAKAPLPVTMLLRCPSDMEYSPVICDPGIQNTPEILRKASAGIRRVQREALPSLLSKIRPQTDAEEAIKSLGGLVFFFLRSLDAIVARRSCEAASILFHP